MSAEYKKVTVIEAGRKKPFLRELYSFRGLLYFLSLRDVLVRYKQTVLGIMWAIVRPFFTMIVFTTVFGKLAHFEEHSQAPYALVVFAGLLPWQFFSTAFQQISDSFIQNSSLISKIYFPRIIIPLSSLITSVVDLIISLFILMGLMVYYNYIPDTRIFMLPFFILLASFISIGFGLFMATFNVYYRDFRYIIPFCIQLGLYISPVGFSSDVIPEKWRFLYSLNPMVGVIDGFRWCILKQDISFYWPGLITSIIFILIIFIIGLHAFRKMERTFVDRI
ncbi:ABC transporter permease [Vibrio mangrovi]|uniref:Transport permease protein n=1 Tax=Vibrio mangrovi TaxID=474394 RepID=A0A1Y6IYH0_9VIBR|nr:ABC transporter permease [Vibrio mangrovi]MDW6002197.1 ABC transporter permease [Vibrio mangrovi]SMS01542.1 Teichoic acid translocation permease protein TagG [Vibrio mangrovi]